MSAAEWDLFPSSIYAGDSNHPLVYCLGDKGCGAVVVNSFDARRKHVDFHNDVEDGS
jgi:hypothetical protein